METTTSEVERSYYAPGGLALKIAKAMESAGWSPKETNDLAEDPDALRDFLAVRRGGKEIKESERVRVLDDHTLLVNLGATPLLPFDKAEMDEHHGEGWVKVHLRTDEDELYCSDPHPTPEQAAEVEASRKLALHLHEKQKDGGRIGGYEFRDELADAPVQNANLLDALCDHPTLFPEHWKADEQGRTRFLYFWGTTYRHRSTDYRYVRRCCWRDGAWRRHYRWLAYGWFDDYPAVVLAS